MLSTMMLTVEDDEDYDRDDAVDGADDNAVDAVDGERSGAVGRAGHWPSRSSKQHEKRLMPMLLMLATMRKMLRQI